MEIIGYVTLLESNDYMSSHFLSSSEERTLWEQLSDDDKKVLLNKSFQNLENYNFIGYKTHIKQEKKWPRNGSEIVPEIVKNAQVEEAVSFLVESDSYKSIQNGIKSESLGAGSYSYNDSSVFLNQLHPKSYQLIKKYIKKSYYIG